MAAQPSLLGPHLTEGRLNDERKRLFVVSILEAARRSRYSPRFLKYKIFVYIFFCLGIRILYKKILLCSGSDRFEGMKRGMCLCGGESEWGENCKSITFA